MVCVIGCVLTIALKLQVYPYNNPSNIYTSILADDLSTSQSGEEVPLTGLNSILPKELGNKFYSLPIIRRMEKEVCAVAAWDSSIQDNVHLNKVTEGKF